MFLHGKFLWTHNLQNGLKDENHKDTAARFRFVCFSIKDYLILSAAQVKKRQRSHKLQMI